MSNNQLTHVDENGKARMVDVSAKPRVRRTARAEGFIRLHPETIQAIKANTIAKGDVLATARIAGIMAAKQTASLIPLCHNIEIEYVQLDAEIIETAGDSANGTNCSGNPLNSSSHCGVKLTSLCTCTDK
ncbi:MAG TPA: cyclic pyranopterin monophosphate synthase MoaC, partial [Spirochaetales bacterium]|nr:cyclic pyranopterin monophosphate synthase MoaC [Spirochaetales bacterium]